MRAWIFTLGLTALAVVDLILILEPGTPSAALPAGPAVDGAADTGIPERMQAGPALRAGAPALQGRQDPGGGFDAQVDLVVRLLDRDGTPLPGLSMTAATDWVSCDKWWTGRTDEDGVVRLPDIPACDLTLTQGMFDCITVSHRAMKRAAKRTGVVRRSVTLESHRVAWFRFVCVDTGDVIAPVRAPVVAGAWRGVLVEQNERMRAIIDAFPSGDYERAEHGPLLAVKTGGRWQVDFPVELVRDVEFCIVPVDEEDQPVTDVRAKREWSVDWDPRDGRPEFRRDAYGVIHVSGIQYRHGCSVGVSLTSLSCARTAVVSVAMDDLLRGKLTVRAVLRRFEGPKNGGTIGIDGGPGGAFSGRGMIDGR